MFGNKYGGDDLAKEFYKLMEIKKIASDESKGDTKTLESSLQNHSEDSLVDPAQFLNDFDDMPEISDQLDNEVKDLDSWASDSSDTADKSSTNLQTDKSESYVLDSRALQIMNGLGKIAGSLKLRGENFAADVVEATALQIKKDIVMKTAKRTRTLNSLNKIASSISSKGDQFTADIVKSAMSKIANLSVFDDELDPDYDLESEKELDFDEPEYEQDEFESDDFSEEYPEDDFMNSFERADVDLEDVEDSDEIYDQVTRTKFTNSPEQKMLNMMLAVQKMLEKLEIGEDLDNVTPDELKEMLAEKFDMSRFSDEAKEEILEIAVLLLNNSFYRSSFKM